MEIPVLVEPTPAGFRAAAGSPFDLSADGPTPDAALDALRERVADRLKGGAQLRSLSPPQPPAPKFPVFTPEDAKEAIESARRLRANPMFEEMERAIQEYRKVANAVPDPDDPATHWPPPFNPGD